YARMGKTEPQRETVDMTDLASKVASEALIDRSLGSDTVSVEPGLVAEADPRLIGLVLNNLIDNALKYQSGKIPPQVEIGQDSEGAFYVRDNGIGFDMRYVEKLFKPFERLHRDGEYTGTGIGLANVERIVERHGGRVWAEGRPNEGATFR